MHRPVGTEVTGQTKYFQKDEAIVLDFDKAVYCANCESVTNTRTASCRNCSSMELFNLRIATKRLPITEGGRFRDSNGEVWTVTETRRFGLYWVISEDRSRQTVYHRSLLETMTPVKGESL